MLGDYLLRFLIFRSNLIDKSSPSLPVVENLYIEQVERALSFFFCFLSRVTRQLSIFELKIGFQIHQA